MTLTLYVREGCHLCDAAEQVVRPISARRGVELRLADIDDPATPAVLRAHYDSAVPVLHLGGVEVARHRVDAETVEDALDLAGATFCLMAKFPEPGRVKTRLTVGDGAISPAQAAGVHRLFLLHLLDRFLLLRPVRPGRVVLCFDPPGSGGEWRELLGERGNVELLPQSGGNLGDRLAAAYETLTGSDDNKALGGSAVLFFGSDAPDVPDALVREAVRAVSGAENSKQAVLGPTTDGGYWTVGVPRDVSLREILHDIPWSSGNEYVATVERFRQNGYRYVSTPPWEDVDHPADLRRAVDRLSLARSPEDRRLYAGLLATVGEAFV